MNDSDLERIRFMTRHFRSLQGLLNLVPGGLMLLAAAVINLAAPPDLVLRPLLALVVAGAAILLIRRARSYYADRFGLVEAVREPAPTAGRRLAARLVTLTVLLVFVSIAAYSPRSAIEAATSTRRFALLVACLCLWRWWQLGSSSFLAHYLVIGLACIGLAVASPSLAATLLVTPWILTLMAGVGMTAAGLCEHLVLVRTMRQIAANPRLLAAAEPAHAEVPEVPR